MNKAKQMMAVIEVAALKYSPRDFKKGDIAVQYTEHPDHQGNYKAYWICEIVKISQDRTTATVVWLGEMDEEYEVEMYTELVGVLPDGGDSLQAIYGDDWGGYYYTIDLLSPVMLRVRQPPEWYSDTAQIKELIRSDYVPALEELLRKNDLKFKRTGKPLKLVPSIMYGLTVNKDVSLVPLYTYTLGTWLLELALAVSRAGYSIVLSVSTDRDTIKLLKSSTDKQVVDVTAKLSGGRYDIPLYTLGKPTDLAPVKSVMKALGVTNG